jgi:hypothetical protein
MEYYISDIDFDNVDDVENREVIVTLNNGTEVHICACYESWEQYNGTTAELEITVDVANCANEWLHGIGDIPVEAYDYINDPHVIGYDRQVEISIVCDKGHVAEFLRELANDIEEEDENTDIGQFENFNGCAEITWPDC